MSEKPQKPLGTLEVAARLGVAPLTVRALARSGELPGYLIGTRFRFLPKDVEAYLQKCRIAPDARAS